MIIKVNRVHYAACMHTCLYIYIYISFYTHAWSIN